MYLIRTNVTKTLLLLLIEAVAQFDENEIKLMHLISSSWAVLLMPLITEVARARSNARRFSFEFDVHNHGLLHYK
jgi:hypothetical protein